MILVSFSGMHAGASHAFEFCCAVFLLSEDSGCLHFSFLLYTVFLLNEASPERLLFFPCDAPSFCWMRPSLLTFVPRCRRACLGGAFLLSYHSRASSTSGTDSLAAYPCCVELLTLSFSSYQARLFVGSRSATSHLATALRSARGLHHCIRQLSFGLLEVGLRYVLDLAASHRLGHLCLPLHLWTHCSVLRDLDLFLKLFDITIVHLGHFSCRTRDANFAAFLTVITRSLCNWASVSVSNGCIIILLVTGLIQLCSVTILLVAGETGNRASKFALSRSCCSLWSCCCESVHHDDHPLWSCCSIVFLNELWFRVSLTKRRMLTYTVSEVQPGFGFPCATHSVHRLHLGDLVLYLNSHINNFVCVLILRNLDVLGWLIFFWLTGSVSLRDFLMIRDVSTSTCWQNRHRISFHCAFAMWSSRSSATM